MSLTILDTTLDEELRATQTGTGDDNDVTVATYNGSTIKTAIDGLGLTFVSGGTGFPQHAEKTAFVSSTNTSVTDYFLTSSATGTPFPAGGVATSLFVATNKIFLFATSDPNIIVGRVGTGNAANASGAVALVIGVEETKAGGFVTNADMWISLYAPIVQSGTNLVDALDQLDLTGLVYLGSNFSTSTEVPFSDFSKVPSGNNLFNVIFPTGANPPDIQLLLTGSEAETLGTINVSTQGIGANAQHVENGSTLRIDTVRGMVQGNVDAAPEVNNSGNIDYVNRVDLVKADFQLTQVNPGSPNARADLTIFAFQVAGTSQEAAYLTNAIGSDGATVEIDAADVKILNLAGGDVTAAFLTAGGTISQNGMGVTITGLRDDDRVAFTTDNTLFDRFLITNVDSKETFDIGNINVTSLVGGSSTEFGEVGSKLNLQDDGPTLVAVTNNGADVIHDETPGLTDDDVAGTDFISGGAGPQVQSLFAAVVGGEDPDVLPASGPIGYARSTASLLTISSGDAGADGPGANPLTYALAVSNATYSGVETTGGTKIFLYNGSGATAGLILGRVGNEVAGGDTANASGTLAFALAVNSGTGEVFVAHYLSLLHPTGDGSSFDERINLATGALSMSVTRSDSEGDTVTDSGNDISLLVKFDDDGPGIAGSPNAGAPNNLEVANTIGASDSSSYVLTSGADGLKSYTIVGPADSTGTFRWAYNDTSLTSITGTFRDALNVDHNLYTLALNSSTGGYLFTMVGRLPSSQLQLSTEEIKAGGPDTNSIDVGVLGTDPRLVNIAAVGGAINESNDNVGVGNGNLDPGESLTFKLFNGATQLSFEGINIGTKSASGGTYAWSATPTAGGAAITGQVTVGKNGLIVVGNGPTQLNGVLVNSITINQVSGSTTKIGIDDIDILIPASDIQLDFTVRETDGDNDFVSQSFTVDIDGNNDGIFSASVSALSLPVSSASTLAMQPHHLDFQAADYLM